MSEGILSFLNLKVITSHKLLVDEQVSEVSLPGLEGDLGILPGHRPYLIVLGQGVLSYKWAGGEDRIGVSGGYAEIRGDSVLVFTQKKENDEHAFEPGRG
jgi:F-type H+-transporting ATPase subunit epsilon